MFDPSRLPDPATFYGNEGLELKGRGEWRTARCPLHGGESLRVFLGSGGFKCMAGCDLHGGDIVDFVRQVHGLEFEPACRSLGAWVDDGNGHHAPLRKSGEPTAREKLRCLKHESMVVALVGCAIHDHRAVNDHDHDALIEAVRRIQTLIGEMP